MGDLSRRYAIGASIVLAALIAVLAAQTWAKATRPTDLQMYLAASKALWTGADPYAVGEGAPFIYPLFVCVVLWPLWHMPLAAHVSVWFVLSVVCAAASIVMIGRMHGDLGRHRLIVAVAIVAVFLADVMQSNLRNGQINFIVLAACVAFAWYWLAGRGLWAAIWLGVAISLKITPAVFLVMLAARREWRRLIETALATVILAVGLPWLVAGSRLWGDYRGYIDAFLLNRATGALEIAEQRPLSLATFFHKHVGAVTSMDVLILGIGIVLVVAFVIDRGRSRSPSQLAMLISLYLTTIVMAAPMTEAHHLAFVMPGLVLLAWRAMARELRIGRVGAVFAVLAAFALMRRLPAAGFVGSAGTWLLLVLESRSHLSAGGNSATANGVFQYH